MKRYLGLPLVALLQACATSSPAIDLPNVRPPVQDAAPTGLGGSTIHTSTFALDASDLRQRFFGAGPTNIFRILDDLDQRIDGINARSVDHQACLTQAPVAYHLTPFGSDVPFFAQCYETVSATEFVQFGQVNGATYLYSVIGAGPVAAQLTPIADAPGKYEVHAWIGIADGKRTGGSYGVIELVANESTHSFEMAVAGIGFGYCGAQLKADSAAVYTAASSDMGTTCSEVGTLCVAASDLSTPATCGPENTKFALAPLGRMATGTSAASLYPGAGLDTVKLDGSDTDATVFGPTAPAAGVGAF